MNDFQRIQVLCDALEGARQEIIKALEDLEALQPPPEAQSNDTLVQLLEKSIDAAQAARAPQSIEEAVQRECAGDCANCQCLGEK